MQNLDFQEKKSNVEFVIDVNRTKPYGLEGQNTDPAVLFDPCLVDSWKTSIYFKYYVKYDYQSDTDVPNHGSYLERSVMRQDIHHHYTHSY